MKDLKVLIVDEAGNTKLTMSFRETLADTRQTLKGEEGGDLSWSEHQNVFAVDVKHAVREWVRKHIPEE